MTKEIDIKEFAMRVERLCDFFIAKKSEEDSGRDGSKDLKVIEDLKEDAADIHMGTAEVVSESISGLDNFMRGGNLSAPDPGDGK